MRAIQAEHPPFHASEASDSLYNTKLNVASFFLIGTFLGVIFFIGAGSVLYFRMYTDLTNEQEKYITITKIGLTEAEMKQSATIQLAILILCSLHYGIDPYDVCDKDVTRNIKSLIIR